MAAYFGNKQRSHVSPQLSQTFHPRIQQGRRPMKPFPHHPTNAQMQKPYINHSPNPQMQQPQGYYAHSNSPQSSNLPNLSWRGNSPHPRSYYGPGVGFPSRKPTSPVVQDKATALVLAPVPISPTAQVMVQDVATLVLDPTSGIAPTMSWVKEGTLALVLIKA